MSPELLPAGGDDVQRPVDADPRQPHARGRVRPDPCRGLRDGQEEGDRRKPAPRPPKGDRGGADQRHADERERRRVRAGLEEGWREQHGDRPEPGDELGVVADRDQRDDSGAQERADEAELGRDDVIEPGRADEADRDDRETDGRQHVAEQSIAPLEEDPTACHGRGSCGEADQHPELRADPSPAERETQEEDRAKDQRDPADDRRAPDRPIAPRDHRATPRVVGTRGWTMRSAPGRRQVLESPRRLPPGATAAPGMCPATANRMAGPAGWSPRSEAPGHRWMAQWQREPAARRACPVHWAPLAPGWPRVGRSALPGPRGVLRGPRIGPR